MSTRKQIDVFLKHLKHASWGGGKTPWSRGDAEEKVGLTELSGFGSIVSDKSLNSAEQRTLRSERSKYNYKFYRTIEGCICLGEKIISWS